MRAHYFIWTIGLLAVLVTSSCAPAPPTIPAAPMDTLVSTSTALASATTPEATASVPTPAVTVQAIATSRGPNLEATDPATVNLASGQLQLVEFFRFT